MCGGQLGMNMRCGYERETQEERLEGKMAGDSMACEKRARGVHGRAGYSSARVSQGAGEGAVVRVYSTREKAAFRRAARGQRGTAHGFSKVAVHAAPIKGGSDGTTTNGEDLDAPPL